MSPPSAQSWFQQIRDLCRLYFLPHPLELLENPPPKAAMKKLVKLKVSEYWRLQLSTECQSLDSLQYFDPHRCSLLAPHPMWTTAAHSSYESNKSKVLARMASGRYRTEMMCRHWSSNRGGYCLAGTCHLTKEDLEHLLVSCPALELVRQRIRNMWLIKSAQLPELHNLLLRVLSSSPHKQVKFILDSTSDPVVVAMHQIYGQSLIDLVLYLTRTWAYCLHREKMIITGRWPEPSYKKPKKSNPRRIDNDFLTTQNSNTNSLCISGDVPLSLCLIYDDNAAADNFLVPATNIISSPSHTDPSLDTLPGPDQPNFDQTSSVPLHDQLGIVGLLRGAEVAASGDMCQRHSGQLTSQPNLPMITTMPP